MIEPPSWMSESERAEIMRVYGQQPVSPGLGDVVASATKAVGMQPCGKCRKRQAKLNAATPTWIRNLLRAAARITGLVTRL